METGSKPRPSCAVKIQSIDLSFKYSDTVDTMQTEVLPVKDPIGGDELGCSQKIIGKPAFSTTCLRAYIIIQLPLLVSRTCTVVRGQCQIVGNVIAQINITIERPFPRNVKIVLPTVKKIVIVATNPVLFRPNL